jgi:hypothetical protein
LDHKLKIGLYGMVAISRRGTYKPKPVLITKSQKINKKFIKSNLENVNSNIEMETIGEILFCTEEIGFVT